MKILLLSSFLPYPLSSGGHVRLFNLLKELSKEHEITLVCEKREYQTQHDIEEVSKICEKIYFVDRKKQWSFLNVFHTGLSPYPFLMIGHTQAKLTEIIFKELSRQKFDLIHVETFYVMQNLPETSIPVVLVEHNIEYVVYKRYLQNLPLMIKPFLFFDVKKMEFYEKQFWKKATKVIAVSESEKKIIGREDTEIIPNGVDTEKFKMPVSQKKENEKRVLFIGDFKWIKNIDALGWILRKIWPNIQKESPELKLWVVGKHIPKKLKSLGNESVIFDEESQEETEVIFHKASVLLAPIRTGGGTSFKILEAMASGLPVVTTSIGAEGMTAKKNSEILIADTEEEIVSKVIRVLADEKLYLSIQKGARARIEKEYNWKIIANKLEKVYLSVLKK